MTRSAPEKKFCEPKEYLEDLPDGCPPSSATSVDCRKVLRLVPTSNPQNSDFFSHAKLGKRRPPSVSPCFWASCSVFCVDSGKNRPTAMKSLPKLRNRNFVAILDINENSGKILESTNGSGHIHLWPYKMFDPVGAVIETKKIER
ncbi:hypothetical protein [Emcibacter nanhaiensis]|uniref:Uncharacterized protein n=1 Tax=Emcibacter nanhaiensis TaxID=1505037 RepID=A0A501PPG7_9PROT|nr:hypothetical protein [Emcibacter nanhaiensis]TPD61992.1 hypothetical protein FIV46_07275 [Emcibacter nanhaiensis]